MSKKLFIKHFPSRMTQDERQQFLHSFGALNVQCFPDYGKMKYSCFATFYDEQSATNAMHKLHQLNLFGFRLSVEYANDDKHTANEQLIVSTSTHNVEKDIEFRLKQKWTQLHSISQSLGLNYPFSPILKYKYPKANKATVTNIANTLLWNSKFYTQVLHLMNKMNLPPPFEEPSNESRNSEKVMSETDSESEIEIDTNSIANNSLVERNDFRRKRKKLEVGFVGPKKDLKRQRKSKTTVSITARVSDLFEDTKTLPHKSAIEINVKDTLQSVHDEVDVNVGGFGRIERKISDNENLETNEVEISEFITEDELRKNRLNRLEYSQYSVFKNYEPGKQSCRLYVKNLDKKVEVHDLKRIFGKFVDWKSELERNTFHVCLLKEGRMKGQAFITFSNEQNAKTALNETNGFILNGKPMVVCFARSSKAN